MCGCALLKAQLAAKTEESCLETEPEVSIRCPCLGSLSLFCDFSLSNPKKERQRGFAERLKRLLQLKTLVLVQLPFS